MKQIIFADSNKFLCTNEEVDDFSSKFNEFDHMKT